MSDPSAIRRHHSYPRRQGNLGRREVWRDIQAKGKKHSSRCSFRDKLGRELIIR